MLRGVAVLGILLMNIVAMGLPFAYEDPSIIGNRSAADYWVWAVNAVLVEGKMRAILSMLFGAGILLIASRAEPVAAEPTAADIHLRRNLWLLLFGAIHSYLLLWPGDILFTYGVAGLPLFAFRRLRPRNPDPPRRDRARAAGAQGGHPQPRSAPPPRPGCGRWPP